MSNIIALTSSEFTSVLKKFHNLIQKYDIDEVEFGCSAKQELYVAWWTHADKILLVAGDSRLHYRMESNQGEIFTQGFINCDYDFLDLYRRLFE